MSTIIIFFPANLVLMFCSMHLVTKTVSTSFHVYRISKEVERERLCNNDKSCVVSRQGFLVLNSQHKNINKISY